MERGGGGTGPTFSLMFGFSHISHMLNKQQSFRLLNKNVIKTVMKRLADYTYQ